LLLAAAGVFCIEALLNPAPSRAQAAEEEAAPEAAADASLNEELATPEPRTEPEAPPTQSFLGWLYGALKLRYTLVFLFITFNLVALMVMNGLAVRRDSMVPQVLIDGFDAHLNERRYQEAYELAKADESFLGKVLAAGMAKLSGGYDAAMEAMQEVGEEENMKREHLLGYVALCAQVGPMIGLLGTVDGMVQAFDEIAKSATTPKPSQLADGIGTALVTTVVGLLIAIPSIIYYQVVRNRMARLIREVGLVSEGLMKRFSGVGAAARPQQAQVPQQPPTR
jgi:biopolymer transport protein ExbB